MQFCQCHWANLRAAVDTRGMSHLVARDGKQALEAAVAQIEGTDTVGNWDPLMAAHWAIAGRVMEGMGLAALGDICPLCEVQKSFDWWSAQPTPRPSEALDAQGWIDSCMDAMRTHAVEKRLLPSLQ